MIDSTRRDLMIGAGGLAAAVPLFPEILGPHAALAAAGYDPSMSVSLPPEELAKYRDPKRLAHIQAAQPLVNRERANEIMDKYGLDALVASTPKNVYYLSSHDNAFYHTGIEHMLFAVLPRRADAAPTLVMWGALLYHLDYRPTWMPAIQVYTAPAALERGLAPSLEEMKGDPPAMRYNRNLVRQGAALSERDLFQLALAAEYVDKTSASGLHAIKRALVAAGLTKGKIGFDDPRMIPWMADVGLADVKGADANNIFREIRMVKSANEVALLREVSRRCELALNAAIASLHVGQTIADVEDAYRKEMGAQGGNTRWLIINQDGLNSGRIERDKVIKIDSVGEYKGYVGDIGRSIVVGTPSDETARRNEANQKALREAYAAIRPGTPFPTAAKIVADVMKQEGFNGFGSPHAVGLDHTDMPTAMANPLLRTEPPVFAENTVFTLDVPYLEIGYGSSHVEDMMVVTKSGAVPLSSGDVSLRIRPA
ncbi:MAG: M24 family metallopeptidase [Rhodospirillaceae bacterium]|nr:M24 family metallopeptidase [Rhodospirillaceae bacterium]